MTQTLTKQPKIGFVQKYALQYYTPCLQILINWIIYFTTKEPAYMMFFIICLNILGRFLPKDSYTITNSIQHNRKIFHVFPLIAHILFTWATIVIIFIDYPVLNLTSHKTFLLGLAVAHMISASIDASHELIHRPQKVFQAIGLLNLAIFQFTAYPIQHLYLHHKNVGTENDPITSPKNQNFYFYTIKAYFSAHKFLFNYSKKAFFGCMIVNWTYLLALFYFAWNEYQDLQAALLKVRFFFFLGLGGVLFLEAIQYIEHYGLVYRREMEKQELNLVSAWNAQQNMLWNWLVFRFQRHSDHHQNAYKLYTTLELTDKMPKFPFSFVQAMYMALIPPLWYYVANPYADQIVEKKPVSKTHHKITKIIKEAVLWAIIFKSFVDCYQYYYKLV